MDFSPPRSCTRSLFHLPLLPHTPPHPPRGSHRSHGVPESHPVTLSRMTDSGMTPRLPSVAVSSLRIFPSRDRFWSKGATEKACMIWGHTDTSSRDRGTSHPSTPALRPHTPHFGFSSSFLEAELASPGFSALSGSGWLTQAALSPPGPSGAACSS